MKGNCCFLGHRKIVENEELIQRIYDITEMLIVENGINTFYFGSRSQFDRLCYTVVNELKCKYPYIKRVYVRAEFQYINKDYSTYLLQQYDDTYFPEKVTYAKRKNRIIINLF